ncbi:glutamate ABC transporter substrate-binding protein [Mycolicibacterium sp. XJ870]
MPYISVRLAAAVVAAISVPLSATACAGDHGGDKLVIGTKFDQPGLALKGPDGTMSGLDVDVAKYVAAELGYSEDQIEWKEAPSAQRETLIQNDQVEFIVATYSITDARKEKVAFAGPYLITGQSLLVRSDTADITGAASLQNNRKVCSVAGSVPAQRIKDEYPRVQLQQYDTYSACVEALKNGGVDAVTTDETILAGYAAQEPGLFNVVGELFSEERYGIGLKKDDADLLTKINDAIVKMEQDGEWKVAWDTNLGPAGLPAPKPPQIDQT